MNKHTASNERQTLANKKFDAAYQSLLKLCELFLSNSSDAQSDVLKLRCTDFVKRMNISAVSDIEVALEQAARA